MTKYVLVSWPEYQIFMESDRYKECIDVLDWSISAKMVPEDLYEEIMDKNCTDSIH